MSEGRANNGLQLQPPLQLSAKKNLATMWQSANGTLTEPVEMSELDKWVQLCQRTYLFFLIPTGIIGNLAALCVILLTKLRKFPPNLYLTLLTVSDTVHLVTWMFILFDVDMVSDWVCKSKVYFLHTSGFISSWAITALSIDRYQAIFNPLSRLAHNEPRRTILIVLLLLPAPFLFNIWVVTHTKIFTIEESISYNETQPRISCDIPSERVESAIYFNVADALFAFVLPSLIVVVLNSLLVIKLIRDHTASSIPAVNPNGKPCVSEAKNRSETIENNDSSQQNGTDTSSHSGAATRHHHFRDGLLLHRRTSAADRRQRHVTRMLIVVPVVFVVLNTPSYAWRLRNYVVLLLDIDDPHELRYYDSITELIALTSFAVDFIVYVFASGQFRAAGLRLCRRVWRRVCGRCGGVIRTSTGRIIGNNNNTTTNTFRTDTRTTTLRRTTVDNVSGRSAAGGAYRPLAAKSLRNNWAPPLCRLAEEESMEEARADNQEGDEAATKESVELRPLTAAVKVEEDMRR